MKKQKKTSSEPTPPIESQHLILQDEEMLTSHIRARIVYGIILITGLLATGTAFYAHYEKWSWVDALYFSAYTITTVGYGEFVPTSDFTKLFTVAYLFVGVGSGLYVLSSIASELIKRREIEWLKATQKRNIQIKNIGKIGKDITNAAAKKFRYDRTEITKAHDYEDEENLHNR